jgi:endonuclease/exonuclease/phosphatase family metal-dependent hydrolase
MQLRVMTYNIHRAIGLDRRFRPERVQRIVEHHRPDILLLQEVDEGVPRSGGLDLARELASLLEFSHYAVGHNVALRQGRYGNATLSRFPILRERNIDLTVAARKPRGCQHTTVRLERPSGCPREIEVFNLHLGLSARERARQVGILVRSGEFAALGPGQACVVGGDFNDWRSLLHPIFTEILSFECATQPASSYDRSIRTYPAFSPRGGLDKIYYRGPLNALSARACRLRVSRMASDHLPVIADFEVRA